MPQFRREHIMLSKQYCPENGEAGATERKKMAKLPYAELLGSLMWISRGTRPDVSYTAGMPARVTHNPGTVHWEAALKVLSYLKSTRDTETLAGPTAGMHTVAWWRHACRTAV